ncbi:hypothetical protein [Yersinia proxima]|uniref:hypothetical protein n=1 Tax=Yersinia proxima TaxID=2890316 RepID=UPI001D10498F|nr:hypothetical protein [Yersinia proxima]
MKELDSFTVEQLNDFIESDHTQCGDVAALARIALAAKRAEGLPGNIYPDISGEITALEKILKWILNLEVPTTGATNRAILLGNTIELLRDCQKPIVATPQLNSPEIPEGWKLTPINPTAEMMAAAMECDDVVYDLDDDTIFCVQFDNIYAAMIAAAPEKTL